MKNKWRVLAIVALLWMCFHFAMTGIYSMDFAPVPRSVRAVSQAYAVPLFHQNWSMFAPEVPAYSLELEYRYDQNDVWSNWRGINSFMDLNNHPKVYYMEQSICSGLAAEVGRNMYFENGDRKFDVVVKSFDYSKAIFFVHQLHNRTQTERLSHQMQMRMMFHFNPALGSGDPIKSDTLVFPIYLIPEDVR